MSLVGVGAGVALYEWGFMCCMAFLGHAVAGGILLDESCWMDLLLGMDMEMWVDYYMLLIRMAVCLTLLGLYIS